MNNKVILTRGLQASGKTTWAKQFIQDHPDYIRLSRDDFRHMLDGYTYSEKTEAIVTDMMQRCFESALTMKKNLVIDETHLAKKFLDEKILMLQRNGYDVTIKDFPITLSEALARDAARPFSIGATAIKRTWRKHEIELKEMIDRNKPRLPHLHGLPDCIIVDIDGTLASSVHRKIFDETAYGTDEVIVPVVKVLRSVRREIGYTVLLFSGREDKGIARKNTERWLIDNDIPHTAVFMRKEGDHRDDTIVKREMFEEHVREKYNVAFVIDDRPSVVQMWVDLGLFVFNVNQDPYCRNDF